MNTRTSILPYLVSRFFIGIGKRRSNVSVSFLVRNSYKQGNFQTTLGRIRMSQDEILIEKIVSSFWILVKN